jgi:hypothetical protein
MSRTLTSEMQTATTASVVRPFFLISLHFPGDTLRFWTGNGDLQDGNNTYIGAGDLLSISDFAENLDLQAVGVTLTLNGVKETLVQKARDTAYQGKLATIKLGAFDIAGDMIDDPVTVFRGTMDVMTINEGAETSVITLTLENTLLQLERTKVRRYTDADQQIDYPGDKGFEFVNALQEAEVVWGRAS